MNRISLAIRRFHIFNGHTTRVRVWMDADGTFHVFGEDYVPTAPMIEIPYIEPSLEGTIDYTVDLSKLTTKYVRAKLDKMRR